MMDVAEVHDCFTIAELVATEDLGLVSPGDGGRAVVAGETAVDGRLPVNPSGGLIAKGHPVGASGVGQIYDLALQLRGEAVQSGRRRSHRPGPQHGRLRRRGHGAHPGP